MESRKYFVTIPDASKDGDIIKFTIQTKTNESADSEGGKIVLREYEDFVYLLHCLSTRNNSTAYIIPTLPPKPSVAPVTTESKVKLKPTVVKTISGDEYYQDCKRLQQFIQDVADHPIFQNDDELTKFLTVEEVPIRAAVKKGLLDSFVTLVDNARFHHHKDVDEDFQLKRDNTNMQLLNTKQCAVNIRKVSAVENACVSHLGNVAMTCRNSATVDTQNSKILTRFLGQFSDVLDELMLKSQNTMSITEDTIGFSLELYSRDLLACQEMLFRRTCKMVELENATKALEKAKPKNHEQLTVAKDDAEKVFEEVSEIAKNEYEKFTRKRIEHYRESLTSLADRQISNHLDTCDILTKVIDDLKSIQHVV